MNQDNYNGEIFLYNKFQNIRDLVNNRRNLKKENSSLKAKFISREFLNELSCILSQESANEIYFLYFQQFCVQKDYISDSTVQRILLLDDEEMEDIDISREILHEEYFQIQKESAFMWFNLVFHSTYPIWSKYWALKGLERMAFNTNEKKIVKRKKSSLFDFPEIVPGVFHKTMQAIVSFIQGEVNSFQDPSVSYYFSKEYKSQKPDFWDLYNYYYKQSILEFQSLYFNTEGIWREFSGIESSLQVYKSLEDYPVAWCLKSLAFTKKILSKQNILIYYTQNNYNEFTIPRMAILYSVNKDSTIKINQFRGVETFQNLDFFMYKEQAYLDKFIEILTTEDFLEFLEEIYYHINYVETKLKSPGFKLDSITQKFFTGLLDENFLNYFSFISKERIEYILEKENFS